MLLFAAGICVGCLLSSLGWLIFGLVVWRARQREMATRRGALEQAMANRARIWAHLGN
jgi:hypothetical protein